MRKSFVLAAAALALTAGACGRKQIEPPPLPPVDGQAGRPNENGDLVELPGSQAAMIAAAGTDTIYFDTAMSNVDANDQVVLAAQARWLLANRNVRASIEGHADERGTREYNQALGERRANAAKNYLISRGVPANRLIVVSWGKERPIAIGSHEQAWARNRRAVTVVVQ